MITFFEKQIEIKGEFFKAVVIKLEAGDTYQFKGQAFEQKEKDMQGFYLFITASINFRNLIVNTPGELCLEGIPVGSDWVYDEEENVLVVKCDINQLYASKNAIIKVFKHWKNYVQNARPFEIKEVEM